MTGKMISQSRHATDSASLYTTACLLYFILFDVLLENIKNEAEIAFYDDFKLAKNPLIHIVCKKNHRSKG